MTLSPSYLKLQRCWLRSFPPITVCIYAHGDERSAAYLQLQVVWVYRRSVIEVEVVLPTFHADKYFSHDRNMFKAVRVHRDFNRGTHRQMVLR
ncbi:Uncharacterised protein [Vibrio cholerae]|nr:Uncharacterised protein [Vibrio cholerae]CSA59590.1 Uncharacterised protein [Vibrio cholerae]CSA70018.1 Uncharacterised protein [Vibrio cholerae]CSB56442.1 Uncharacterised protein [Vibrio cholerae]CSC25375.1 Uncharacterised protein [Vibrio cholerae]